ncbi:hypothetical protein BDW59DRAFT_160575 [Aspergillus cavernicola]|uniref:Fungal-specific transcription factor domain-containing protein n=1 Tax=Aspergillus cavernicola TaxID=176166 RepID=A0ABR4IGW2_9EURO
MATRVQNEKERKILPKPAAQQTSPVNDKDSGVQDTPDGTGTGTIYDQDLSEVTLPSLTGSDLDINWASPCSDFDSLLYSPILFMHDIALDYSLVLVGDEYQALHHYQERFISDRLLRTPRWSMLGCIFQSVYNIPMVMHFLIALSSMDLNQRSPCPVISPRVSKTHFRKGSEMLIQLMNLDTEPHHFSTLSAWFFLFLFMSHRDTLDKKAVNQLSLSVLNYIQRYNLDSLSAGTGSEEKSSAWHDPCLSTEPGLIGRLLLFLASEDIGIGFEGCGGHLAKHLFGNDDLYRTIFSKQQYILERYWGQSYPEHEVMHDLETTAAIELGNKVGLLFHKVNELSKEVSEEATSPRDLDIEKGIIEIETQYSSILRMTRSSTAPRNPLQRTADAAVSNFYFVKLYYFRLTLSDSDCTQESPPHIIFAMTNLMNIAHRAFSEQDAWGHEIFQLPLFMAGIETNDQIHVEWIISKMSRLRFRTALSRIISIQDQIGGRLSIARVRQTIGG